MEKSPNKFEVNEHILWIVDMWIHKKRAEIISVLEKMEPENQLDYLGRILNFKFGDVKMDGTIVLDENDDINDKITQMSDLLGDKITTKDANDLLKFIKKSFKSLGVIITQYAISKKMGISASYLSSGLNDGPKNLSKKRSSALFSILLEELRELSGLLGGSENLKIRWQKFRLGRQ